MSSTKEDEKPKAGEDKTSKEVENRVRKKSLKYASPWLCHLLEDEGPLWPMEGLSRGNDVY